MGNELFGVDIAGIIGDVIGPGVLAVTITREAPTTERDPDNLTGGLTRAPPQSWACQGFWEDFTGQPPPGVEVLLNDRKAVLIGDTLPAGVVVQQGDGLTIEGQTLWVVKLINRDPAAAVYVYQCRDRGASSAA
jgi:hypothetical protein